MRDKKNQDSADWFRTFNIRSQAVKRNALHAKLLEQKDVHNEKLQQHRSAKLFLLTQPLNVTSQQPHCCPRRSNYNLFFYPGSMTKEK